MYWNIFIQKFSINTVLISRFSFFFISVLCHFELIWTHVWGVERFSFLMTIYWNALKLIVTSSQNKLKYYRLRITDFMGLVRSYHELKNFIAHFFLPWKNGLIISPKYVFSRLETTQTFHIFFFGPLTSYFLV